MTRAAVLLGLFLVLPASAAAQDPPPCPTDKAFDVILTSQEAGQDIPLGRLLARARRAGRCVDRPLNGGIVHSCKVARSSTLLRWAGEIAGKGHSCAR